MIASSGLVIGVDGTEVMPAPMRLTRRDAPARRRVRAELVLRADPSGALASCWELAVRVDAAPAAAGTPAGSPGIGGGGSVAPGLLAAMPQTLQ
jgi:hypothetical protein